MAASRNALLIVVFMVASFVTGPGPVAAQPVYASPYGYIHDIPYFAVDLMPGDTVEVGIWLELLASEPTTTFQYTGEFGAIIVSRTVTFSGPSYNLVSEELTAEAIMAECNGGWIPVNERILQQDNAGNFSIIISKVTNLAPCNWADDEVTPILPPQLEVCGDNNDAIQFYRQPRGLSWDAGVWSGNTRTVTFTADPGYILVGQSVFTYVDSGNCIVGPVEAPVQTYVCGANNDTFVLAAEPPYVILAFDSTWRANQRIFHYVADSGYTLDGPGEFIFTDQPNRMCASPLRTPPVVINTPPARPALPGIPLRPTPRGFPAPILTIVPTDISITQPPVTQPPGEKTSAPGAPAEKVAAADSTRVGEAAVFTLTPLAVILGAIAVRIRRHDD